jgi:hypothetical protein
MNKKFILIMLAFTLTVPGFFIFSYWHLGIFADMTVTNLQEKHLTAIVRNHSGDYNKTGEEVVKAAGELSATVKDAAKAATETEVDHEEVKNWLTTIFKALVAAFK